MGNMVLLNSQNLKLKLHTLSLDCPHRRRRRSIKKSERKLEQMETVSCRMETALLVIVQIRDCSSLLQKLHCYGQLLADTDHSATTGHWPCLSFQEAKRYKESGAVLLSDAVSPLVTVIRLTFILGGYAMCREEGCTQELP